MTQELLLSPLVEQAIELSAQWHDGTYRKGRWRDESFPTPPEERLMVPVIAHLTAVGLIVSKADWDEVTVAAAFLHDIVEDGNRYGDTFRYEKLCVLIGEEVADLVMEVTEIKMDEEGKPRRWRDRKDGYLETLHSGTDNALAISLADKIHNLWSINGALAVGINVFENGPERRALSAGPEEQKWFYSSVLDASHNGDDARLKPMRKRLAHELQRYSEHIRTLSAV